MQTLKVVRQYLDRYAEAEAARVSSLALALPDTLRHALLIPAKDEDPSLVQKLLNFSSHQAPCLFVLIINQAEGTKASAANTCLWQHFERSGSEISRAENCQMHQWPGGSTLLLIDRFSAGQQIPAKQGVGLARKIAADAIVALMVENKIHSDWIYSSDADTRLPADYFCLESKAPKDASAAHLAFEHSACDDPKLSLQQQQEVSAATALYEQGLRYYQQQLSWAGSPYGFFTIGSCLAFRLESYCQARGFPSRAAGEDFYLLNKLAKLGSVYQADNTPIRISARLSDRVPFGTGPAVGEIIRQGWDTQNYPYYHPSCFQHLRLLLQQPRAYLGQALALYLEKADTAADATTTSQDQIISEALKSLGWDKFQLHCQKQSVSEQQFSRVFHHWFDGFKTLKFIHFLREHHFPNIPLQEAQVLLASKSI